MSRDEGYLINIEVIDSNNKKIKTLFVSYVSNIFKCVWKYSKNSNIVKYYYSL